MCVFDSPREKVIVKDAQMAKEVTQHTQRNEAVTFCRGVANAVSYACAECHLNEHDVFSVLGAFSWHDMGSVLNQVGGVKPARSVCHQLLVASL